MADGYEHAAWPILQSTAAVCGYRTGQTACSWPSTIERYRYRKSVEQVLPWGGWTVLATGNDHFSRQLASYEDAWLRENDQTHRPGWDPIFFKPCALISTFNFNVKCTKKTFHHTKHPDFDPSSLATTSTWEAETWYALLCRIDLDPQKVSARKDLIYEIRIWLWAHKQYPDGRYKVARSRRNRARFEKKSRLEVPCHVPR